MNVPEDVFGRVQTQDRRADVSSLEVILFQKVANEANDACVEIFEGGAIHNEIAKSRILIQMGLELLAPGFKKLLSEEDAKLFQAQDFIGHIVTYVYDATGDLKGFRKGSYNWNRPCPHCENGYKTIKTFEGESANTLIEIEKVAQLENPSDPDKPDKIEG